MKYRIGFVYPWVNAFMIPMYISRVDINEPGYAGTHGWQVRYFNAKAAFFSDVKGNKRKNVQESLNAATEYLQIHYIGQKCFVKNIKPRIVWSLRKGRRVQEARVRISHPMYGKSDICVYVGTENTIDATRITSALLSAMNKRNAAVAEHTRYRRSL